MCLVLLFVVGSLAMLGDRPPDLSREAAVPRPRPALERLADAAVDLRRRRGRVDDCLS
jgi:hypothetical protein